MKKKNIIALALSAALTLALTACGGETVTTPDPEVSKPAQETAPV